MNLLTIMPVLFFRLLVKIFSCTTCWEVWFSVLICEKSLGWVNSGETRFLEVNFGISWTVIWDLALNSEGWAGGCYGRMLCPINTLFLGGFACCVLKFCISLLYYSFKELKAASLTFAFGCLIWLNLTGLDRVGMLWGCLDLFIAASGPFYIVKLLKKLELRRWSYKTWSSSFMSSYFVLGLAWFRSIGETVVELFSTDKLFYNYG